MKDRFIAKKHWNENISGMAEIMETAAGCGDLINFSVGDPDLITDERIINAAFEDAKKGYTKYTDNRGYRELRDEIRKFYDEEYGVKLDDSNVFVSTSACFGMYQVLLTVLDPGDEVIVNGPYFTCYSQQIEMAGGVCVECPSYEEEDFQINMERLEACVTDRTKAIIINSPANPTGAILTKETIEKVAQVAKKYDLLIISDEIYTIYSYGKPFVSVTAIPDIMDRCVILNSFSKNFIMTGWRIGNVIAPANMIRVLRNLNEGMVYSAPSISQRAALYALRHRKELEPPVAEEYKKRLNYCAKRINDIPKMHVQYPPQGTFYLFPNIKETGLSSMEVCLELLNKAQVLTFPGSAFGKCGEGYIRLACTLGVEKSAEAFDRIEKMDIFR